MKRIKRVSAGLMATVALCVATATGAGPDEPAFKFMLGPDGHGSKAASLKSDEMLSRTVEERDGAREIVWRGHRTAGADFTVTARVTREGEARVYALSWCGYAGERLVETVFYPVVDVPRTDDAKILFPYSGGYVYRPDWRTAEPGRAMRTDANVSFHMSALLNGEETSYEFEQRGARTQPTRFEFRQGAAPRTANLSSGVILPVSRETSSAHALPFTVALTPFRGGWYEASRIYARTVRREPWYQAAKARNFGKLRDIGMWFWNRRTSEIVIPPIEKFMADAGVPAALDWYWWHKTSYDTGYPNFWPPREPEERFRAAVRRLNAKGIYCQTYMNGMTWDVDDPSWKDGGEQGVKYLRDGTFRAHPWNRFTGHRLGYMCGEAPQYQARMREQCRILRGCGFDGQYLDMIGNASYGACWRKDHAHPFGGGDHMVENFRTYVKAVRADNPGLQLCTEDVNESYLDLFESVIVLSPSYERNSSKAGEVDFEVVPAFQSVYHGAIVLFGNFAMLDGIPAWDPLWPDKERWTKEEPWERLFPDQFFVEHARGVIWGMQPSVHNFRLNNATEERYAEGYRFMIDTARFYHANREYLFDGEMLNPGELDCGKARVEFLKRGTYTKDGEYKVSANTLPTVFHSVWRAPCGRVAAILVNWSRRPQRYSLRTPDIAAEGELSPRSWRKVLK